jgi:hypothetical protein
MASILDLYKGQSKDLGTDKIGPGKDETPYSIGIDETGTKAYDEKSVAALEAKAPYTRYGIGDLPKAASDSNQEYGKRTDVEG